MGSGTIGLPAGWRITGSYQGTVDTVGPDDAFVSLGRASAGGGIGTIGGAVLEFYDSGTGS